MELCGYKQITAHAHVQSRCMWLNFEHTRMRIVFKKKPRRRKSNSDLLIKSKNSRNRSNWRRAEWYLDLLMSIDVSFTATRKERERYENNYTLDVNGQGPKPGPMKKRADFPQAVSKLIALKHQVENPNPYIPKHFRFRQRPIEEKARLERQWKR